MKLKFKDYIKTKKIITDGAFGTYFSELSQIDMLPEKANTENPKWVSRIHTEYLNSGARLLRTNTFSANQESLKTDQEGVNNNISAAFEILKDCIKENKVQEEIYLAGDIGPIFSQKKSLEGRQREYLEIARQMIKQGADLLVFETFPDLYEIKDVICELKKESDIFILVQFSVSQSGYSTTGISAGALLNEANAIDEIDAIGLNCSVGPGHMYSILSSIVSELQEKGSKPISALPNAGYPKIVRDKIVYMKNAPYFVDKMEELSNLGVQILGGCCGTTPSYIALLSERVINKEFKKSLGVKDKDEKSEESPRDISEKKMAQKGAFFRPSDPLYMRPDGKLIAVELSPPVKADDSQFLASAEYLKKMHVNVVTFPDSPSGRTRADSVLMACRVMEKTKETAMPHICCRDKNGIALRSQFLAAYLCGIRNLLVVTGDPVPTTARMDVKNVFNFDSVRLMQMIKVMNEEEFADDPIYYGGAINQNRLNLDVEINRVLKKMEAGASFFLSQPVFTKEEIDKLCLIKRKTGARILCGIMPLVSRKNAMFIKNEMSGMCVTEEIVQRYENAITRQEGEKIGISLAGEIMEMAGEELDGYYFSIPFNRVYLLEDILS